MRKLKHLIWIIPFLAVLILVTVQILKQEQSVTGPLCFDVRSGRNVKRITCWTDQNTSYVFLPSYADVKDVTPVFKNQTITIEGKEISQFLKDTEIQYGLPYAMESEDPELGTKICFEKSDQVASVYIDTASRSMDAVNESETHDYKEQAIVSVFTEDGTLNYHSRGKDYIKGHGNWSWEQDKKSYKLTLDKTWDLLGMGNNKEYILVSNVMDPSFLRNYLIYAFADQIGSYEGFSPDCRYADVYFNGEYDGLYLLVEKIEATKHQLPLNSDSYLLEMNLDSHASEEDEPFYLSDGVCAEIKYPKVLSAQRRTEIENQFCSLLDGLEAGNTNVLDQIDLDSWTERYLIDEVFLNYDGGVGSQYFFYDAEKGRFFAGPCWDFDNTLGIGGQNNTNCILVSQEYYNDYIRKPLFYNLMKQSAFSDNVMALYQNTFLPKLNELIQNGIAAEDQKISAARQMNAVRWKAGFDDSDTEKMKQFLQERIAFLNSLWVDHEDYCVITLKGPMYHYYYIQKDTECGQLPIPEQYGVMGSYNWLIEDTGEVFHYDSVITEDLSLVPEY